MKFEQRIVGKYKNSEKQQLSILEQKMEAKQNKGKKV